MYTFLCKESFCNDLLGPSSAVRGEFKEGFHDICFHYLPL